MLLRIHQVAGAHTGRVWTFDQAVVRLGRMPDSDVVFDAHADLDASGRHAEIVRRGDQWVVRDSGSRNGTFVNGERIEERLLSDGDVVECGFGGPRVRVELLAPREVSGTPSANTEAVPIARPNAPTAAAEALPPISGDAATAAVPSVTPPPISGDAPTAAAPSMTPPYGGPQSPDTGPMQGGAWGAPGQPGQPSQPRTPPAGHPETARPPAPVAAPPVEPPAGDRRFGQRTVGMMIGDAVQGLRNQHESSQRRWKIFAGCLAALLGVVCLGFAVFLLSRPAAAPVPDVAGITASVRPALWRFTGADQSVFCTGFAVRRDLIATSGRCVLAVEARQAAGKPVTLVGEAGSFPAVRMWRHPETPSGAATGGVDVGLVEIAGPAPAMVTLASPEQLEGIREATHLLVYGHSAAGALALPVTLQSVDGELAYTGAAPYGAPLLDASGVVVGLHAGPPVAAVGPGTGVRVEGLLGLLAGLGR